MSSEKIFKKEDLDNYLKELGKEFKKLNGKTMPAEIVMIGGAAIFSGCRKNGCNGPLRRLGEYF